ncbi:FKBP-type peptidyl-prolyl cis-trans isomerase [Alistipes sp. OttesenSCG-928-B03]|nr:FKBP-type peptidyl-prolyl cis-trans isomerase [Alistipes sp. OttesenSCG-928-B03]
MRLSALAILFTAVLGAVACTKNETLLDSERTKIAAFMNTNYSPYETRGDVYVHVTNADRDGYEAAVQAETGDQVVFEFVAYGLQGASFSEGFLYTNSAAVAAEEYPDNPEAYSTWTLEPFSVRLGDTGLMEGLQRGLPGARKGDILCIAMTSDMGAGDKALGVLPANTPLMYLIAITEVTKK